MANALAQYTFIPNPRGDHSLLYDGVSSENQKARGCAMEML